MEYHRRVNLIPDTHFERAMRPLTDEHVKNHTTHVYTLAHPLGKPITDQTSFFESVLHTFPQGIPLALKRGYIWNAVLESVEEGISNDLNTDQIDIVWHDIHLVSSASLPTLIEGLLFLKHLQDRIIEFFWETQRVFVRIVLVYDHTAPHFKNHWMNMT